MDATDSLPRTILYSINPTDTSAVAALCGCFELSGDGKPKVVQGSAWWFGDNIDGMTRQMREFANLSAFGNFLGMLTDSRSFLSYTRHEYFRRILCISSETGLRTGSIRRIWRRSRRLSRIYALIILRISLDLR